MYTHQQIEVALRSMYVERREQLYHDDYFLDVHGSYIGGVMNFEVSELACGNFIHRIDMLFF